MQNSALNEITVKSGSQSKGAKEMQRRLSLSKDPASGKVSGKVSLVSSQQNLEEDEESDNDIASIDSCKIRTCKDTNCLKKKPHVHTIKRCVEHKFCPVAEFESVTDADENTALPFPMKYELGNLSDSIVDYEKMLDKTRKHKTLKEMGLKCIVSDYAIAQWYAQSFKLDINNMPTQAPNEKLKAQSEFQYDNRQISVFEQVSKFLRKLQGDGREIPERELMEHIKKSRNKGVVSQSGELNDMIAQEVERKAQENEHKDPVEMMLKMKPLVYPITRTVKKFKEFGQPKTDKPGKATKERDGGQQQQQNRWKAQNDSVSQSSMGGSDGATSLSRQPTQVTTIQSSFAGSNQQQSQAAIKKKVTIGPTEFETIAEENPSVFIKINLNADKSNSVAATAISISNLSSQQIRRGKSQIDPKDRVYNPYASDGIRHFGDVSRNEIDKLMIRIKKDKLQKKKKQHEDLHNNIVTETSSMKPLTVDYKEDQKKLGSTKSKSMVQVDRKKVQSIFNPPQKGQFDMSMRARREQIFKNKMMSDHNINVRQGRTYTKFFNKQIDLQESQKGVEGTCFQYINQFQDQNPKSDSRQTRTPAESIVHDKVPIKTTTTDLVEKLKQKRATSPEKSNRMTGLLNSQQQLERRKRDPECSPDICGTVTKCQAGTNTISGVHQTRRNNRTIISAQQQHNQEKALSSLISHKAKTRVQSNQNDRRLQKFINRKHRDATVTSATSNSNNNMMNSTISDPSVAIQQYLPQRISTSQHQSTRKDDRGVHQQARRRIKEMLDSQYLCQDLRKGTSNIVSTHPYGTLSHLPVDNKRERTLITPTMIKDFNTVTIESKMQSTTQRSDEVRLAPLMGMQTAMSKRVNQVSFIQPNNVHVLEVSSLDVDFKRNLTGQVLKEPSSSKVVVQDQFPEFHNSSLKAKAKDIAGPYAIYSRTLEEATTVDDQNSSSQQDVSTKNSGYFVTPEDYNFEVTEPTQFYQKELFVKLPLAQPLPTKANQEIDIFKSAEFWLSKGYVIQSRAHQSGNSKNNEADNVALDYYLSGVKIDPQHYGCIYNAGCCHFFTGKFQNARKWFNLATLVSPRCPDGYYGKTLSCLKLGLYDEALQSIVQIDQHFDQKITDLYDNASARTSQLSASVIAMTPSESFNQDQITFLHAVCCKILNKQEEAQTLYQRLQKLIYTTQRMKMVEASFAVILVDLQKDRNIKEDNVHKFQQLVNMYDKDYLFDQSTANNLKRLSSEEIEPVKRLKFLSRYLHMFPFFKRIPEQRFQQFIKKITIVERLKDELVIIPPKDQVMIILNGQIVLREHELDKPGDFEIKQIGKSGHILFAPELDDGKSNQPLIWPVIYSTSAQLALIDRETFEQLWRESRDRDLEVAFSQLNLHIFFKTLSKQTFFRIINEKSRVLRFLPGELVMPIHHRSPWNNILHKKYAQKQMSVLEQLDNAKEQQHQQPNSQLKSQKRVAYDAYLKKKTQQNKSNKSSATMLEGLKYKLIGKMVDSMNKLVEDNSPSKSSKGPKLSGSGVSVNQLHQKSVSTSHEQSIQQAENQSNIRRPGKNDPSDYEKFCKKFSNEPRHDTSEQLKRALLAKKLAAKKKFVAMTQGVDTTDFSDEDSCFDELNIKRAQERAREKCIHRPENSFCRPIMLMYTGSARCVNNYFPGTKFVAKRLATGSILGESDTLKMIGIDFFGDIYAEKNGLECLVIDKPDLALDAFEVNLLRQVMGLQNHELQNMLETRFEVLRNNPIKHY